MSYTYAFELNDTNTDMLYGDFGPKPTPVSPSFMIHTITMLFVVFAPNMMFMLLQRGYNADRAVVEDEVVEDEVVEEDGGDDEVVDDDEFSHLLRLDHDVVCIGGWKDDYYDKQFDEFCSHFHPDDVSRIYCLSNEEASVLQAKNAFRMFETAYGLETTLRKTFGLYFLAIGTFREYTHFTVMNDKGEIVMNYREPGIMFYNSCVPLNAEKYNAVIENIAEYFEIGYIVCYGSIHSMLTEDTFAPIIPNNHALPEKISTTMADFAPHLGWGQGIGKAKMLVVDYFQMPLTTQMKNDSCYMTEYCLSSVSFVADENKFVLSECQVMYVDHETGCITDEKCIIDWNVNNAIIEEAAIWVSDKCHVLNNLALLDL